jgi:hypothetical protein
VTAGFRMLPDGRHEGRVHTMSTPTHVLVLCPAGHLMQSCPMAEWAGSHLEARVGLDRPIVACAGALSGPATCPPSCPPVCPARCPAHQVPSPRTTNRSEKR